MRLTEELRAEHDLIEQVAGAFRTFVDARLCGEPSRGDGARFLTFFRLYAGEFHHAREEDTLFAALTRDAGLPADRGPVAVLTEEHRRLGRILDEIEPLADAAPLDAAPGARLRALALAYTHGLWHHIDAENSVLFPEGESRLRKQFVAELPSREMTAAERDAMALGASLLQRYPPLVDRTVIRGDGCVLCAAFGESCAGLEQEWWSESEWDELDDHLASD